MIHRRMCVVITLYIRNAFNSGGWNHIMEVMNKRGLIRIVDLYFSDRHRGVTYGSILSPKPWNL